MKRLCATIAVLHIFAAFADVPYDFSGNFDISDEAGPVKAEFGRAKLIPDGQNHWGTLVVTTPSRVTVPIGDGATEFTASGGVDSDSKVDSCARFRVLAPDGRVLCEKEGVKKGKWSAMMKADLTGLDAIVLEVSGEDGILAGWFWGKVGYAKGKYPPSDVRNFSPQLGILTPPEKPEPHINGPVVYGVRPGHPIIYRLPVTGAKPIIASAAWSFGALEKQDNLKLQNTKTPDSESNLFFEPETRILTGAIGKPGEYKVTFTAENRYGRTSRDLMIKVGDKIALTPAMGWNSWNSFGWDVTADDIRNAADALEESGLADHGYAYVNIDDFWQNNPKSSDKRLHGPMRDENGKIKSNLRFPDMKGLADYIHAKGLKAGLYSSPGPTTCGGCTGSWQHEEQDAQTYAEWGFDYLKHDWCSYSKVATGEGVERAMKPYRIMGNALRAQNRDILFSLCQYGKDDVGSWGAKVGGQSWRITGDIFDKWGSIMHAVNALKKVWQYSAPGEFNDPDMLCIGPMHWNNFTLSRLAPNEQYTHISLWALAAAPLMIGCDMTKLDGFTRALLANDEVIAIDQDVLGLAAAPIVDKWNQEIWARPLANGSIAVGLVNKELEEREIVFDMKSAGMEGEWTVRDVWRQKDEGVASGIYKTSVYGHATHLVRFIPGKGALLRVSDIRDNALAGDAKAVKTAGVAGTKTFWKRAGFDASGYPPAARPYREAALMAYDFIFRSPGARHLLETGETDPGSWVNAYPTKMMSAMIEAMLRYAKLRPERASEALKIARAAADYLIKHSEKPGSPLASCPPTYETRPGLKVYAAKTYEGQMMMIYPADAGSAYLKLAKATNESKYRDAAVAIAETYLRLQGEDGTWPLMMFLEDGRPNGSHRLIPTGVADFLLAVADATGEAKYREAASRAFAYIETEPCRTFDWSAQFEDVGVKTAPYSNLTKDEAVDYARHVLDVFPGDSAKAEEARKLLEFGEDLFVHWERSGQHQEWTMFPCVCEQQNYNVPVDASVAKMIEAYLAFYRATKTPLDLAKAKALGDSITRAQFEFGDIPTVWTRDWVEKQRKDRRGGWLNCTVAAAFALEHLADATENGQPAGCPDFEIELPRASNGAVVKAADFGFSETNENNIVAINAALAEAKRTGAARVELAPGTYRCFERTRGEKGIAIEGFEDFTFDGKGATLVFRRDHEPLPSQDTLLEYGANVTVRGCRRTVVENFNMDWDWETDPLAVWCRCVGKHVDNGKENSSWADFELEGPHPKYPQHVPIQLLTPFTADKSGSRMDVSNGPRYMLGTSLSCIGSKSEWLSPTRLRVWPAVRPDYGFFPEEQAGLCGSGKNREYVRRLREGGTFTLSHSYYGLNGFVLDSNEHFTLRNVDLWACRGFGIETRGAQKYWQLVNFNIRPKPGERRPVTSTADAHHFIRSRGCGKMIGCEVAMNQDDYFNIHDRTQIAQKRSARTVEVVNSRGIGYTGFGPGTRIRLRHEDYSDAGWTGNIVKIDGESVTFDRDLPEQKGMLFVLIDDEYASENFLFKDCWFHDSPWARGLVQCNNVTFDGCTFGPMSGLPLKFMTCYSYNVWCEGIGCSNIVVRNCRFENCLADNSWHVLPNAPQITVSMLLPPEYSRMDDSVPIMHPGFARQVAANKAAGRKVKPSPDAVCDMLIEKNTFVNPRGLVLLAENASRVTFRDNMVVSCGSVWEPLPCAGKIRIVGGSGNDVPEGLLESDADSAETARLLNQDGNPK